MTYVTLEEEPVVYLCGNLGLMRAYAGFASLLKLHGENIYRNMYNQLIKLAPRLAGGVAIGGILGYLFYYFYGCNGTCLISSDPWTSTAYGAFMGLLFSRRSGKKTIKAQEQKASTEE